jgi:hypothetical protein
MRTCSGAVWEVDDGTFAWLEQWRDCLRADLREKGWEWGSALPSDVQQNHFSARSVSVASEHTKTGCATHCAGSIAFARRACYYSKGNQLSGDP